MPYLDDVQTEKMNDYGPLFDLQPTVDTVGAINAATDVKREVFRKELDPKIVSGQRERVYQEFAKHQLCWDAKIARALGLPEGRISARRNELVAAGRMKRLVNPEKGPVNIKDPLTGCTVALWTVMVDHEFNFKNAGS